MNFDLRQELERFGATPTEILSLVRRGYDTINYLDLQPPEMEGGGAMAFVTPEAVVEVDGRPLLYALRVDSLVRNNQTKENSLRALRTVLACRGEPSYIAVIEPGQITLVPTHYATDLDDAFTVRRDSGRAGFLVRDLAMGAPPTTVKPRDWERMRRLSEKRAVHDLLFRLLDRVTEDLRRKGPLKGRDGEILSLVGRCLFTCFLIDRNILTAQTLPRLASGGLNSAFATPRNAALTCEWLDVTFNGELLPLGNGDYEKYFHDLATKDNHVFHALSKIMERTTPDGQYFLDCSWINFAHVPVGLLSQVYESYAHKFFSDSAKQEGMHYTPRHIAEFMVEQAFAGIETAAPDEARVLDPAAGAGVFLVLCLRKLVKERWHKNGVPPRFNEIRDILNQQIRGFDVNGHALKLAALSLYLTAIELDGNITPANDLTFDPLEGRVLFNTRQSDEPFPQPLVLGSLNANIPAGPHYCGYDLVIGNPAWTPWSGKKDKKQQKRADALNKEAGNIIRTIARRRDPQRLAHIAERYENPLKAPDVPFVWCAMEWAKPDAVIAFALHGRLLFRRADRGASARDSLFDALKVTGILNGTALRMENVWPNVQTPFCLLFARNALPGPNDHFYYVSPEVEHAINQRSIWRIDYQSAQPIEFEVLKDDPTLLKTLFRGTVLDADLMRRITLLTSGSSNTKGARAMPISAYWKSERGLFSGRGFESAPSGDKNDASFIIKMGAKELTTHDDAALCVDATRLKKFRRSTLHRTGREDNYRPPIVLFSQTPGAKEDSISVRIALDKTPIAYNFSFYGYSTHGHPQAHTIAKYLFLLANSDLPAYCILMTSARYGVERDTIYVEDVNDFPIIPIETLSKAQIDELHRLATALCDGALGVKERVNRWVADLYGLRQEDIEVIEDSLAVNQPTSSSKKRAQQIPTGAEIKTFSKAVERHLQPFFDLTGDRVEVVPRNDSAHAWRFIEIRSGNVNTDADEDAVLLKALEALANQEGASRIFIPVGPARLCVGILAQYRYWTPSRARLCAMDIIGEHSDVFEIQAQ